MLININIEQDEDFRKHIKDMIAGQVRAILRDELAGIVSGEIAKLRIMQPGDTTFSQMIDAAVNNAVQRITREVQAETDTKIRHAVANDMKKNIEQTIAQLRAELHERVATCLDDLKGCI